MKMEMESTSNECDECLSVTFVRPFDSLCSHIIRLISIFSYTMSAAHFVWKNESNQNNYLSAAPAAYHLHHRQTVTWYLVGVWVCVCVLSAFFRWKICYFERSTWTMHFYPHWKVSFITQVTGSNLTTGVAPLPVQQPQCTFHSTTCRLLYAFTIFPKKGFLSHRRRRPIWMCRTDWMQARVFVNRITIFVHLNWTKCAWAFQPLKTYNIMCAQHRM